MYKNKIVNQYAKPYYWGAVFYTSIAILAGGAMYKYAEPEQEKQEYAYDDITLQHNSLDSLSVILIAFCLFMIYYSAVVIPGSINKKANVIAKKYLDEKIQQNPDLQGYRYLLDNPKAVQVIFDVLSKEFSKPEIKRIVKVAETMYAKEDKSEAERKQIIANAEKEILKLVKEHELRDPEFDTRIFVELTRASYVFPEQQQATR